MAAAVDFSILLHHRRRANLDHHPVRRVDNVRRVDHHLDEGEKGLRHQDKEQRNKPTLKVAVVEYHAVPLPLVHLAVLWLGGTLRWMRKVM